MAILLRLIAAIEFVIRLCKKHKRIYHANNFNVLWNSYSDVFS